MTKEELRAKYARVPTDFSEIEMLKDQLLDSGLLEVAQKDPENAGKAVVIGEDGTLKLGEASSGMKLYMHNMYFHKSGIENGSSLFFITTSPDQITIDDILSSAGPTRLDLKSKLCIFCRCTYTYGNGETESSDTAIPFITMYSATTIYQMCKVYYSNDWNAFTFGDISSITDTVTSL